MVTQTDIPSHLTDDDKASSFQTLDATLNSTILYALLHGIYTGILAVTLWNTCVPGAFPLIQAAKVNYTVINKYWSIRRTLVFVIILLYALITIDFAVNWSYVHSAFIENGNSFWTVYLKLNHPDRAVSWEMGIPASISTILADLYMIWCCWMVWGRCWFVVVLPIFSLASAIVSKIVEVCYEYINALGMNLLVQMLYISFNLTTTLSCTLLIIYRIVTVAGVKRGADSRLRVYRHFIEVLVESSALYSISLLVYLVLVIRGDFGLYYLDIITGIAKGVAPTLLIGRAAAGHMRPKDDCDESEVSTLRFQTPSELCTTSFQEPTIQRAVLEMDIEAQPEPLVVFVEKTQGVHEKKAETLD